MENRRLKHFTFTKFFLLFLAFTALISLPIAIAAGLPVLKSGDQVLVELKGNDTVTIGGNEFKYKLLKKNKRLKITSVDGTEGVFFKRYGTKIKLRDLQGTLLHYVLKARSYYKVKMGDGTELAYLKIENGKVAVKNLETNNDFVVYPENGKIIFKDANGNITFTLDGETNPFPAAFLALEPLSPLERVACYLTYR
jgi:hypothetical protein